MKTIQHFSLILLLSSLTSCYQPDTADLIVYNAKIYTCDSAFSIQDAMAIKDGKILQVGPEREILNGYDCDSDHIIDAELRAVYPGFYDAHCHFWAFANTFREVDMTGSKSFEEVISRVITFNNENDPNWITGRGWDQNIWTNKSFPNNDSLSKLFPDKPVLLRRIDGHAAIANQKALELAGISDTTTCYGGQLLKVNGELTGVLIDNAVDLVRAKIPELKAEDKLKYLQKAEYKLFEQGLTSINDAGVDANLRKDFIEWYTTGKLKINNYQMLFPDEENLEFATTNGKFDTLGLHIASFKLIADGALGSRGACLLAPYSDSADHFGTILKSPKRIKSLANIAANIDFQLNTHCIGDSANSLMLNIYKSVIGGKADHRWKIEHAQVLAPEDFDFFEQYHIIPSVQPTHCTSDMPWAADRIGAHRIDFAYAYNTLLDKAGLLALGTDFPIENISTFETFYAAVTRKKKDYDATTTYNASEKLSRKNALMAMTYWAAYSNFEEHERGSLEAGKNADFIILTKDIMTISEQDILNTFVLKTYLNGVEVFSGR